MIKVMGWKENLDKSVEAFVQVGLVMGRVTLYPRHTGELDKWGERSQWSSRNLHKLDDETMRLVIERVKAAVLMSQKTNKKPVTLPRSYDKVEYLG